MDTMHSAAYCRRQAQSLAAKARRPHVSPRRRALLEHLSTSWAVCADAAALVELRRDRSTRRRLQPE